MSPLCSMSSVANQRNPRLLRAAMALTVMLVAVLHSATAQTATPAPEILPHPAQLGLRHTVQKQTLPPSVVGTPSVTAQPVAAPYLAATQQATASAADEPAPPFLRPQGATASVAPITFYDAPSASDGAPDAFGNYSAFTVVSGDFSHRNHLDAVTFTDSTLYYMSNDGKGNFTKTFVLQNATYYAISSATVADINGDGYLDIIAASSNPVGFLVFINNGNGTFAPAQFTALPPQSGGAGFTLRGTYVNVADINHDGKLDVVASGYKYGTNAGVQGGQLYNFFFAGNGDGTFQAPVLSATAYVGNYTGFRGVVLADTNNDGKLDLVAAIWKYDSPSGNYYNYLSTGFGDGAGHFTSFGPATAANTVLGSYYADDPMVAIDLNNDGNIDILWSSGNYNVYTSLGNGDGTFQTPVSSITAVNNIGALTVGDFNRDGYPDVAVFIDGLVSIYQGLGNGSFSLNPVSQYNGEMASQEPLLAKDFDGDGIPDLLVTRPFRNQLAFLKSNGDGTFVDAPVIIPQNASAIPPNNTENADFINVDASGNFFGDGKFGLLAEEVSGNSDYLDYATQNGKGGFNFTRALNLSQFTGISFLEPVTGDFNNDGRDDFILALTDGMGFGLSNGDGTVTRTRVTFPVPLLCPVAYAATGDINHDGNLDIVVAYPGDGTCGSNPGPTGSGFFVLLGDGTGHFTVTYTAFGGQLYIPALADLNHDGKLDLVLDDISSATPAIYVIPGDGTGKFNPATARTLLSGGGRENAFLLTDINKDGIPDLTVLQSGIAGATDNRQKGIFTMIGNGDFTFQAPQFLVRGYTGVSAAYGDFNQDTLPDLVVNLGTGGITYGGVIVYPNLGNGGFGVPVSLQTPLTRNPETDNLILIGDFNNDGATDIVMGSGDGYVPNIFYPNAAGNQLQLVAQSTNSTQFNPLSLSATTVTVGGQTPTGTITFFSNGQSLGSAPLVNGISSLSTTTLAVGTDKVIAKYLGDFLNYPSTSNTAVVNVVGLTPDFTLTSDHAQLNVTTAAPGQLTLTLVANGTFNGSPSFSCQGLPSNMSCAFSANQLALTPGATGTVPVTLSLLPQHSGRNPHRDFSGIQAAGLGLAGLLALLSLKKHRKQLRFPLLTILFAGILLTGFTGCANTTVNVPFTGNVNIVVTGVSGTVTVVHSASISYNVQP